MYFRILFPSPSFRPVAEKKLCCLRKIFWIAQLQKCKIEKSWKTKNENRITAAGAGFSNYHHLTKRSRSILATLWHRLSGTTFQLQRSRDMKTIFYYLFKVSLKLASLNH